MEKLKSRTESIIARNLGLLDSNNAVLQREENESDESFDIRIDSVANELIDYLWCSPSISLFNLSKPRKGAIAMSDAKNRLRNRVNRWLESNYVAR